MRNWVGAMRSSVEVGISGVGERVWVRGDEDGVRVGAGGAGAGRGGKGRSKATGIQLS